ncbi:hypothetical protein [Paraburkholderia bannensis]|uniref:hypothetical protein n=1 Tax=Paraburkholderia bannensis TaxID=765414 RepID=UPI0005AA62D7|nr:hypothetical protein [Paraburkholderia bannensis]
MRELNRTVRRVEFEKRNISGSIDSDAGRSIARMTAKTPISITHFAMIFSSQAAKEPAGNNQENDKFHGISVGWAASTTRAVIDLGRWSSFSAIDELSLRWAGAFFR